MPMFTILLQALLLTILIVSYVFVRKRRFVPTILVFECERSDSIAYSKILLKTATDCNQIATTPFIFTGYTRLLSCFVKVACILPSQIDPIIAGSLPDIYLSHVMLVVYIIDTKDLRESLDNILKLLKTVSIGCDIIVSAQSKDMELLQTILTPMLSEHVPGEASRVIYAAGNPQSGWCELLEATRKHA